MAINVITNFMLVLALCALFQIATTQATSSLSEKFHKCENEFWFKNLSHFKQSLKSKCLKENHHNYEKRHRQYHICNKSFDKEEILSKWEKFSDCRCESALIEMSNFKESNIFVCYQIAHFNKVTGEFLGELTVLNNESKDHSNVAVKFSDHKLKLLNNDQWNNYNNGFYHSKKGPQSISHNDKILVEKFYINGKISKSDSMSKVTLDMISPSEFLLDDKHLNMNHEVAIIPFSRFILNESYMKGNSKDEKKPADENKNKEKKKKQNPTNGDSTQPSTQPSTNDGTTNGGQPGTPNNGGGTPNNGDGTTPGTPNNGDGTTAGTPNNGDGTTPGTPNNGDGTTAGTPNNGDGTTPGTPNNGGGATPGTPNNGDGTTPGTPNNGDGTTPGTPNNGDGTTPGTPNNGDGTTPGTPNNGDGTTAGTPNNGDGTTPGTPNNGGGATPGTPNNGDGTTPGTPNNGDGTTAGTPNNGDGTTPGTPNGGTTPGTPNDGTTPGTPTPTSGDSQPGTPTSGQPSPTTDDGQITVNDGQTNNGQTNDGTTPTTTDNSVASTPNSEQVEANSDTTQNIPGTKMSTSVGLIIFGCVVTVGAAFIGFNTYERLRWRRHYRNRQAAQQNVSLANVPDYNGYGRAY